MTYAEYLKSQGATEDEVKVLDTPIARRAFEAQSAALTAADAKAKEEATKVERYNKWYNDEIQPRYESMQKEVIAAKAAEAKSRAALQAAHDQGLIDVAKDLGYEPAPANKGNEPNTSSTSGFDPNKYFTRDDILQIAEREGDAIAIAQDIAAEHRVLFPDQPLNFRELRREAVAAKKPVEQLWRERYSVDAARGAKAAADKAAYEKKLRDEGASAERERLASQYGNPETRPLQPSSSPFSFRPPAGRDKTDKQPWEIGSEEQLSQDRVKRGALKEFKQQTSVQ